VLSRVSYAAAQAVAKYGVLIFPGPETPPDNVANVILAEVSEGKTPQSASQAAKRAAIDCWEKFAAEARSEAAEFIRWHIWTQQVGDVIEFYAAWTPLASPSHYKEARQRVMRLLAGRKACRDFSPAVGHPGIPKSSLDGARESVWKDPEKTLELNPRLDRRLRLSEGEQLDVVGLTKRLGGGRKGFPSVSRIAADPWLRGAAKADGWKAFLTACENLARKNCLARIGSDWPQFSAFPYEGTPVYRQRHKELQTETGCPEADLKELGGALRPLEDCCDIPEPYLAILVADGDRMGKTISAIDSADKHREFSKQLASFAGAARGILQGHQGCLVYSGGDDVLAFVPVDTCLPCARELHDAFGKVTAQWKDETGASPTLSVGIAIGHFMDPLEDLLAYSRAAEKAAKHPDRDGLAVHLHPRSGAPRAIRGRWSDNLDRKIETWARLLLEGHIPDKAAYDLEELARDYENWPDGTATAHAIPEDAQRLLKRKRPKSGGDLAPELTELLRSAINAQDLSRIATQVLVARRIARSWEQASGGPQ